MDLLGKLSNGLGAIAQKALGGPMVDRLEDWRIDTPPSRTNYRALWDEAISPCHPIVDEQIRARLSGAFTGRTAEWLTEARRTELRAIEMEAKGALATTLLTREVFLWMCIQQIKNGDQAVFNAFESHERSAMPGLVQDLRGTAGNCSCPPSPTLTGHQAMVIARIAGDIICVPQLYEAMNSALYHMPHLLCAPETGLPDRDRMALERLFRRTAADSSQRSDYAHNWIVQLLEAIARMTGIDRTSHPILRAKDEAAALVEEQKRAIIEVGGAPLRRFFETNLANNALNEYWLKTGDLSPVEDLSPSARADALFSCLRVINFVSHFGKYARPLEWPDCPLTQPDLKRHLLIREFASNNRISGGLISLFKHMIRKKVVLTGDMAWELLLLMRSDVLPQVLLTLQVVKLIEAYAKGSNDTRVRDELVKTIHWLRDKRWGVNIREFKVSGLHRLDDALRSMAFMPLEPTPLKPGEISLDGLVASAREQTRQFAPVPPPRVSPKLSEAIGTITAFYGDLADPRKCTLEHVAFVDRMIALDADQETQVRQVLEPEETALRARGVDPSTIDRMMALKRQSAEAHLWAGRYNPMLQGFKARMLAVASFDAATKPVWTAFHEHARKLYKKSKPAAAWLKEAHAILAPLDLDGRMRLLTAVIERFPVVGAYATAEAMRGLIYCAAQMPPEKVGPLLASFAHKSCFQTEAGFGIRDKRMGNACLWALINLPDGAGIPYLARLLNRIKYPSIKKVINTALNDAATQAGVTRGTLDELSVPTHDLVDGRAEIAIGSDGGAAVLKLAATTKIAITFKKADGSESTSVPSALKPFKEEIRAAREACKEIEADLSAQVARLQRLWLEKRDWSLADWEVRYAHHPLMADMTRRLIWTVSDGAGEKPAVYGKNGLEDIEGKPVGGAASRVTLWHPIGRPAPDVLAWRRRLAEREIVQPFKQAHREVYYVTDAERATDTYSNRFAGHILRQHQMMTLARINNWNVTHRIAADVRNDEPSHLVIPAWRIIAELWTSPAGGDDAEFLDSGAYVYIATDRVRFCHVKDGVDPSAAGIAYGPARGADLRMEDVPQIVFSEVMRHCDLFTGVTSVANDPEWFDHGTDAEHPDQWRRNTANAYWHEAALGELMQSGQSRRDTLQEILPALKISDRCRIDGNFLRVQGKVRAYRIHIGSGNILMDPDNRYLCIVKKGTPNDTKLRLPFEGDSMLSLILSKALLLADDDKITDQVILRQIK
jgi:hypothetical protein